MQAAKAPLQHLVPLHSWDLATIRPWEDHQGERNGATINGGTPKWVVFVVEHPIKMIKMWISYFPSFLGFYNHGWPLNPPLLRSMQPLSQQQQQLLQQINQKTNQQHLQSLGTSIWHRKDFGHRISVGHQRIFWGSVTIKWPSIHGFFILGILTRSIWIMGTN